MIGNVTLSCRCGEVRGLVTSVSPGAVNRVVCYCDDCQAFLHHLGRADLLDAQAGTDIVQIAPASLSFVQGEGRIVGLRLGPRGLYRWYASCCRTPVGNTVGPAIPFVGIIAQACASDTQRPGELFGPPIGRIYGKYAIGYAPEGSTRLSPWLMARAIGMVLGWRIRGRSWSHPFFERMPRAPKFPVAVLSPSDREALRPLSGPRASSHRAS